MYTVVITYSNGHVDHIRRPGFHEAIRYAKAIYDGLVDKNSIVSVVVTLIKPCE